MHQSDAAAAHRRPILMLSAAGFAATVNLRAMDGVLNALAQEFATSVGQASHVISAYAIGYGTCQLLVGMIGDRLGKLRLITALCLISAAITAAGGLADSIPALTIARLFAGAAASGIVPVAMAWIGDQIPVAERQMVLARYISGTIAGALIGQAVGSILADFVGWRVMCFAFGGIFLTVTLALAAELRRRPDLAAPPPRTAMVVPIWRQVLGVFRNPFGLTVLAGVLGEGIAVFSIMPLIGASLHDRFGLPLGWIGGMLACFGVGGILYTIAVRRLVGLLSPASRLRAGGLCCAVGILVSTLSPFLWAVPLAFLIAGFGFYLIHNPMQSHATQILPEARGTGVALFATSLFFAQSIGLVLMATLTEHAGLTPAAIFAALIIVPTGFWLGATLYRPPGQV